MMRTITLLLLLASCARTQPSATPLIVITDVYHPHQDVGDNVDLIIPFNLPGVELRAVIIDVTDRFRRPIAAPDDPAYNDTTGPREPGIIPLHQLNTIFRRDVPFAPAVFRSLRSEHDDARDAPPLEQRGIELLIETLRTAPRKVEVVITGSARPLAIALNREPALLEAKIARVHLIAGATVPTYEEWNVHLDPKATARVLRSGLPIALYPCAGGNNAFALDPGTAYWSLPDLGWTKDAPAPVRAYLHYALGRSARVDFLRAMADPPDASAYAVLTARPHHMWETAAWMQIAKLRLAKHGAIVRADAPGDLVDEELRPARITVNDNGTFAPDPNGREVQLYHRADPAAYQTAMRAAFPPWFLGLLSLR